MPFFARAPVGHGDDYRHLAVLAAGDELLDAVEHISVAVLHRCGFEQGGIAAHMRLGQAKRPQQVALRQPGQPLLFLRRVAVAHQNCVDRAVGHADRRAGAAVASGNFFKHQRQRDVIQIGAAELFRHANAVGAQRRQPPVRFLREMVFLVPSRGMRPEFGLRKDAHRVANLFLLLI